MSDLEFNQLLIHQEVFLQSQAFKIVKNRAVAGDLVQETFLKALKNKGSFQVGSNIKAWLFTILKNTFINEYRKEKKRKTFVDETDNQYYINQGRSSSFTADGNYYENEVIKVINGIEFDLKTPFLLFFNGFKYEEIADNLQIPIGTVKSRIFKARQKLQYALTDYR